MSEVGQRAEEVLEAGLKLPSKDRAAYLDRSCGGDAQLRQRLVETRFKAAEETGAVLAQPPGSVRGEPGNRCPCLDISHTTQPPVALRT